MFMFYITFFVCVRVRVRVCVCKNLSKPILFTNIPLLFHIYLHFFFTFLIGSSEPISNLKTKCGITFNYVNQINDNWKVYFFFTSPEPDRIGICFCFLFVILYQFHLSGCVLYFYYMFYVQFFFLFCHFCC